MTTRTLEICGFPISDFDACQRILAEGECCPEHPASDGQAVEYEPMDGFTWDDVEVYE